MSQPPPSPPRSSFRFALPPSLGEVVAKERAQLLASFLTQALGRTAEVSVEPSYEQLAKNLLANKLDAAWAPPFVCARIEAMGVRVLVRQVRGGTSSYRGALIAKKGSGLRLDSLFGKRAVWSDRDSVGGYLLPMGLLRAKQYDPSKLFVSQTFAGSYRAAVEALLAGDADVTSVFAPPAKPNVADTTGISEVAPGVEGDVEVIAYTDEAPNDGVAVAMAADPSLVTALERALLQLHASADGAKLLADVFNAERFEPAQRMGYRALYRVALASL